MKLSLATLVGMPLVAVIIDFFSETVSLSATIIGKAPLWEQLLIGIGLGIVSAALAHVVLSLPFMKEVNTKYVNLFAQFKLGWNEIMFVSFCAGVGEEILFRGAIQPLLGIVITSVFFVAIHGYLNPREWRICVYGVVLTFVIGALGYASAHVGILSAIIAHMMIDIWLLFMLQRDIRAIPETEKVDEDR
ncbi:MAG: CPBP family intramembrane glutamic endopeptidase [Flavobacteriales bacterium]|nr:CPBP family intramembrane glutamic endopeptidase [Flavobacteriales bacterium]